MKNEQARRNLAGPVSFERPIFVRMQSREESRDPSSERPLFGKHLAQSGSCARGSARRRRRFPSRSLQLSTLGRASVRRVSTDRLIDDTGAGFDQCRSRSAKGSKISVVCREPLQHRHQRCRRDLRVDLWDDRSACLRRLDDLCQAIHHRRKGSAPRILEPLIALIVRQVAHQEHCVMLLAGPGTIDQLLAAR